MHAPTLDQSMLEAARRLLERHASVDAAYVLGSAAAGRLRPDRALQEARREVLRAYAA